MTTLLEQVSLMAYLTINKVRNESGDILDFHKYRFLYDIYNDRSNLMCCMKCAQIGFTTYEILKSAHQCRFEGIDILYVLPTSDDVKRFSGGKTNKILSQNPTMAEWTKDKDSTEQKQFGKNTIYYQGSWTERAALMITAKKLIVDEYDRCKQDIVEMYDSRLQSIAAPQKAFFSNPSTVRFGVHKLYLLSDQKKWHVTHSCKKTFIMDESCINYDLEIFQCPKCGGEITTEERRMGEWIKTAEGEWSGYWIPLWIAPWMTAKNICKMKREKSSEFFANFVAGLPYIGSGNTVQPETVLQNLSSKVNDQQGRIIIGVDTGLPIHYMCGNKQGIFYYGQCKEPSIDYDPYQELEHLLIRWPNSILVADQGGDLIGIRRLQAKYPGRVFLVWYRADRKTQQLITWGQGEEYGKVTVDRNRMIQLIVDEMKDKRFTFNGTESDWQELVSHWMNIYRVKEEDAIGQTVYRWERNGPDHYIHCQLYWRVGMDKFSESLAQIIGPDIYNDFNKGIVWNN